MNSPTECNCCQAKVCEVCLSQSSSAPHVRNRVERSLKYEADCGPKNCNVFGCHDAAPLPEYYCHKKPPRVKSENRNSLGSPIGLVTSNVNVKTEGKTGDIIKARYATCLKAFARLHLNDEKEWHSAILDDIMKQGLDLHTSSQGRLSPIPMDADTTGIYMANEQEVLREFELSGFTFRIELMPKFLRPLAVSSTEAGATGDGFELTLENLITALGKFLRQHKYALLKVGTFYALIWRSRDAYFVFDACGRRPTDFQADKEKGLVMLMCFKSLENVGHLINNLSGLQTTEPLVIRELRLVKLVTPEGSVMQRDLSLRNHQYEIVNDDYAYLRSDLHLTLNERDLLRNRSALAVAVAAMVVSKIDHPATWDLKMVDKIICFGVNLWQARYKQYKTSTDTIDVNKFPTTFVLGQFRINIDIKDHFGEGTWHCVPAFKHSELANALQQAFTARHHKLILQINYQTYAIWKKQEFIYLLDPYRHRIMGKQNESKIYKQMEKSATVRMFRAFEVFMNILNQILLDSNRTSHFFLHSIKVKNIQKIFKDKPGQVRQVEEPLLDDYGEILSINEHICFEEAEDLCKHALGEISDYEDDDLKSDVVEIELRTSSSEEDVLEEEEAGSGKVGEMEDIETSSSGEEGGGHKKKSVGNEKRDGPGKAAKRQVAKKGGNNKNKEGREANDNEIEKSNKEKRSKKSEKTYKKIKSQNPNPNPNSNRETDDEVDLRKEKKESKQRENPETDTNKNQDKEPIKNATGMIGKDPSKEAPLDMEQNKSMSGKDKEPNPDKPLLTDKTVSQDQNLSKDNDLSKPIGEQSNDNISKDKLNEGTNKSNSDKSKDSDAKDTNGENQISKSFRKFDDGNALTYDKGEAKDVLKDKPVDSVSCQERDSENKKIRAVCSIPNPNRYPGYTKYPANMTVLGSESGRYSSICKLFQAGFKVADRLLLMTAWGNFVIFRCMGGRQTNSQNKHYYLYDGCTCNFNRFRHFDLSVGTAGLICFEHLHNIIEYIRHLRQSRSNKKKPSSYSAEDICKQFCNKSFILRV